MQTYLRGDSTIESAPPPFAAHVLLLRALVLLIVHALLRGRRWCKVRRGVLRGTDLVLLWCDVVATAASRPVASVTVQTLLDAFSHDAALHAPAAYFIVLVESRQTRGALLLSMFALLQRSTLAMVRGSGYYALVALSLRQLWIAVSKSVDRPTGTSPQLV